MDPEVKEVVEEMVQNNSIHDNSFHHHGHMLIKRPRSSHKSNLLYLGTIKQPWLEPLYANECGDGGDFLQHLQLPMLKWILKQIFSSYY
jgi:hypothetical protein